MPPPEPCIDSNPDIAGIGVRSAIYAQALLSFIPTFLFLSDGHITPYEEKTLNQIHVNILITALALLINAFIQAGKLGISAYHVLVILNLSLINSVGAVTWYFSHFASRRSQGFKSFLSNHIWPSLFRWPSILASMQLCLMGALGTWFWISIDVFGNQPNCTPDTVTSVFSRRISLESKSLRKASIVFYSLNAIPIANLLLLLSLFLLVSPAAIILGLLLEHRIPLLHNYNVTLYLSVMLCGIFIDVLFAVDTELMIQRNKGWVKEGEEVWGFGQTLAVLVVILPTIDVLKQIRTWIKTRKQPVATEITAGPVIQLQNGSTHTYYQGADNYIYESSPLQDTVKDKRVSGVEARPCTPIATISWRRDRFEYIHVYYIDQNENIREAHSDGTETDEDEEGGEPRFTDRLEPIAKAAQNSGLLYAVANSNVPGTIRVGFHSALNPTSITEVVFEIKQDPFTPPIQLDTGDTRVYFQGGDDGHLYERLLDSESPLPDTVVLKGEALLTGTRIVATTWGDNFKHIRIYFVDQENKIREVCSDHGLNFVERPGHISIDAPDPVLLYAKADPASGTITVGFNSLSKPTSIRTTTFKSPTPWRMYWNRIRS